MSRAVLRRAALVALVAGAPDGIGIVVISGTGSIAYGVDPAGNREADLVALHEALRKLADIAPRQARLVELRYFGGLKVKEVAEVLDVSKRTVEGHWTHARAWLQRELAEGR